MTEPLTATVVKLETVIDRFIATKSTVQDRSALDGTQ